LIAVLVTLKEAIAIHHRNLGKDPSADLYSITTVRGRWIFAAVETFSLIMAIDLYAGLHDDGPQYEVRRFFTLGILRMAMTIGVAWVALANMRTFRKLRDR